MRWGYRADDCCRLDPRTSLDMRRSSAVLAAKVFGPLAEGIEHSAEDQLSCLDQLGTRDTKSSIRRKGKTNSILE